jgi:hypothetical protein
MTQGASEPRPGTASRPLGRILFALFGGAAAWTLHFLGSYAVIALGCTARWDGTVELVIIGTLALAAMAAWSTASAWREWRRASGAQPWDQALSEPRGWLAWLMMVGALLGATSLFTILLEGAGALLLPVCGWDVR